MHMRRSILFLIISFILTACVTKNYTHQNAALIIFKTPAFKYADMGFIYENKEEVKAEIYSSGQALMSLEISESSVCMSLLECMGKRAFNKEVLSRQYPEEILENIFRGKAIFNGENLEKNRNGFTQKIIKEGKYNIDYSVLNNEVIFRDTINTILIKIKKQQ
ncbi:MAG: hypothetical protein COB07_02780 [Sulfurovum sp.]|nr:MAG: hypothetical protein COB07_02780 [Sulfurovum sp.]